MWLLAGPIGSGNLQLAIPAGGVIPRMGSGMEGHGGPMLAPGGMPGPMPGQMLVLAPGVFPAARLQSMQHSKLTHASLDVVHKAFTACALHLLDRHSAVRSAVLAQWSAR